MTLSLIHLLLLILVANGAPVIARNLLGTHFATPLDFGVQLHNRDLLGPSKTWRGLVASIVTTSLLALVMGYAWHAGAWVALCALSGDAFSSFIKRRLNMRPSSMAPFLDQIPESLLPALIMREEFELDAVSIVVLVCSFIVLELILSQILYRWGIRKTPY